MRFHQTMNYRKADRVPRFDEGIRGDVINRWREHGMPWDRSLSQLFSYDGRREFATDIVSGPHSKAEHHFSEIANGSDDTIMLVVHSGFFPAMSISGWSSFMRTMNLIIDHPDSVRRIMRGHGNTAARVAENVLAKIHVDAAIFSEPIGGNDKPLISPFMYEDFALKSYEPLLNVLKRHHIETIIFRSYGNPRVLFPSLLKWGFNCVWACESNMADMDYRSLRKEFGREMRLIGGIDLDILRQDKEAIRREVEEKIPPLLSDGGYIPLADGRIRQDVPYENYVFYRELLKEITDP